MSGVTVDQKILDALAAVLTPAATGAVTVDVERDDRSEPYEPAELPALNLLAIQDDIATPSRIGFGVGVEALQVHSLSLVVQIVYRGSDSARQARQIGATVEQLIGADPTLGGLCSQGMAATGRQWLRDDGAEQSLTRQNTQFACAYRTYSNDPTTPV